MTHEIADKLFYQERRFVIICVIENISFMELRCSGNRFLRKVFLLSRKILAALYDSLVAKEYRWERLERLDENSIVLMKEKLAIPPGSIKSICVLETKKRTLDFRSVEEATSRFLRIGSRHVWTELIAIAVLPEGCCGKKTSLQTCATSSEPEQ